MPEPILPLPRAPLRPLLVLAVAALSLNGCGERNQAAAPAPARPASDKPVIAMLPKLINIDYFDASKRGATRAAEEVGATLIFDGPVQPSGSEQNNYFDTWIRQRVQAICVAPNQPKTIQRSVAKARAHGIHVVTWDTDAPESGRQFFVNQVDEKLLGEMLIDDLARQMGEEGEWAIAIASLDAANLNTWRRHAEARAKERYPRLRLVATEVTKEDENYARQKVETLLNAYPDLKGIIGFDSNSVPGAAEAVKRTGRVGQVAVVGNSTPRKMRPYIMEGVVESFYLWDPGELGALTVRVAKALIDGTELRPGAALPGYGPLVFSERDPRTIIMATPIRFTKDNIDQYDFGI